MSIRLLIPDAHLGGIDNHGFLWGNPVRENYLKYLLSCDGFLGLETFNGTPVDMPRRSSVSGSTLGIYRFTKRPSFVIFDTEDNALLYKLGLPSL